MAEGTHVAPADLDLPRQAPRQDDGSISLKVNQQRIETDLILKAFTLSQGNLSRAAQELGISRSTLYRRLRQYGMERSASVSQLVDSRVDDGALTAFGDGEPSGGVAMGATKHCPCGGLKRKWVDHCRGIC